MKAVGDGIVRFRRGHQLWPALALAWAVLLAMPAPARAQLFGDHPPPVPPASVPDPGAAVNLAPPSGPASVPPAAPGLPAALPQPSIAAVPPVVAPQPGSPARRHATVARAALHT